MRNSTRASPADCLIGSRHGRAGRRAGAPARGRPTPWPSACCNSSTSPQQPPDKRDVADARAPISTKSTAISTPPTRRAQASRCSQCGVPFCSGALPAREQHPRLAEADRRGPAGGSLRSQPPPPTTSPKSAAASARRTGCAKATASSRRASRASPSARSSASSPTPPSSAAGCKPVPRRARTAQSVGIVGAGPGGLAAAEQLRRRGYQVHVYDRHDRVGGLLIYGIPGFKLEKDDRAAPPAICWRRPASSSTSNTEIGRDVTLRRTARAPRRGADRHRRLQGARHRRPRRRACPASCRRSTTSSPPTARASATPCRTSTSGVLNAAGQATSW